jgi:hypothetical protein
MYAPRSVSEESPQTHHHPDAVHQALARWNHERLAPGRGDGDAGKLLHRDELMRRLELDFICVERRAVRDFARTAPTDADGFISWFEALKVHGPGQNDPLFPWLGHHATLEQLRWFVAQEVAGEAGFDDLVAMTQVKLPTRAKLELARNYWDEMGRGREPGMHGPMLEHLANSVNVKARIESTVWESLALGNLLVGLASNRHFALQSVGALGAVELTAPTRATFVVDAMKRLGYELPEYRYFALHAVLDVKHSEAWNKEVLRPLVEAEPGNAFALAEGALLRLHAGYRCFNAYRRHFGI